MGPIEITREWLSGPKKTFVVEKGVLRVAGEKPAVWTWKQALELSIEKWRVILAHLKKTNELVHDGGWVTCALCWKFRRVDGPCEDCPVGVTACEGTPYWRYAEAVQYGDLRGAIREAEAELKFLEGLWEKGARWEELKRQEREQLGKEAGHV